ncbi:FtsX-like permease family protein [Prevotella brunnea]|uniref:Cell division protein FtsX n=1 Tax=Prevotella brunnea TaxID=2508867 RepID=A0A5C8GL07_9BACT|nr:permease-like cell division protein FtsX [Prevotella brunnea]MDR0186120.1 FtsX-like permease family protein [Prevotella brunnea]TXJ62762.1 FtsX-like permease family protein [Prevotella brunnea]
MTKRRNKSRKQRSLQVVTLCISTAMVLILIGMVVLTVFTSRNLSSYVKENLTITMILQPDMSNEECATLCTRVNNLRYISNLNFISKEEALKEGTKELGANPAEFAGENPFTAEIELRLKANYANNDSIQWIAKELKTYKGVSDIAYRQDLVESVNRTLSKIGLVLLVIAALLTVVSFSLINNTIRLSVYARRFSIHTMKLVGASWNFIRMPFLRRAILEGLISAVLAIVVLGIGMYFLYSYDPEITVVLNQEVLLITALVMLTFGILITFFCSWLSVNKFLKMKAGDLYKI